MRILFVFVTVATILGCASRKYVATPPETESMYASTQPTTNPATMKKPFMFNEADLPDGFPAPGPVGIVMLKTYPSVRMARVRSDELSGAGQNGMFRELFNHISDEEIPMTAPVIMEYESDAEKVDGPASMAFLYADTSVGQAGEKGNVDVIDVPEMSVVSVGVRGSYTDAHLERALTKIEQWLAEQDGQYTVAGPARYLGYNSPFVPWFLRYGEVQVPVSTRR